MEFSLTYTPHVGGVVIALAVADLDSDRHLDLVVADRQSNNVDTLFGNRNGTFGEQRTYSTGSSSYPAAVAIADVNKDGQADLIISTTMTDTIAILLGNANGSFASQRTFSTTFVFGAEAVATGHLNEDDHFDLAIGANGVCLMFGDGTGDFSAPTKIPSSRLSYGTSVAIGDFNNDHQMDLAALDSFECTVEVLLNHGFGSFEVATYLTVGSFGSSLTSLALADFNKDTRLDMVILNQEKDQLLVFWDLTMALSKTALYFIYQYTQDRIL
jgi:adhesin/invasin